MAASESEGHSKAKPVDGEIDKELDELLDSALGDFEKNESSKPDSHRSAGATSKGAEAGCGDPISEEFTEQFSDEMAKEFERAMQGLLGNDPNMMQQIEKLAEAAGSAGDTPEGQREFGETLKQTLSSLAQNTEGLQDTGGAGGMDEEMMRLFSGLGMEGMAGSEDSFMPMMQNMMKTLLSKDILYPSLKEISEKYPVWLLENKIRITDAQYSSYSKQNDLIKDILVQFDMETPSDTDDIKKQRFETIMDLMQKMQDLGQPPKEIVGDMAPGLDFDANGVPKFPGSQDACSVM
ncbi:peroxisomal biogenesis factor 19-like [Dreissena polymorpha]|uniref:Peroxin-19 n=1 Tax=Dreissena polymorpha TaxID=45954 RepID=A0A9D4BQ50_DREPO|nr:peroxisomal biogenesis factor 19-like [Dreissena polymorpha]KAH3704464.1 hypothetical protein DPMN_079520 [Dreissena polymorpha]